jgi:hypothetical protein
VLAFAFLSAGPAFYGDVTGDWERFAPLMTLLQDGAGNSHSAASYQSYLWRMHSSGNGGLGTGISAFPSMHVALAVINAFFAFEIRRWLGFAMSAYAAIILASSVALGWHYAIDGYASIAVCALLYVALRKMPSLEQRPSMAAAAS